MLLITCPYCGERAEPEFTYGRAVESAARPDSENPVETVYLRTNPRGPSKEYWRHTHGCGAWLIVERDTASHAILHTAPAQGDRP